MHPLSRDTMCSWRCRTLTPLLLIKAASILISPMSLTKSATLSCWLLVSRWRRRVVLPEPKNPDKRVTGSLSERLPPAPKRCSNSWLALRTCCNMSPCWEGVHSSTEVSKATKDGEKADCCACTNCNSCPKTPPHFAGTNPTLAARTKFKAIECKPSIDALSSLFKALGKVYQSYGVSSSSKSASSNGPSGGGCVA